MAMSSDQPDWHQAGGLDEAAVYMAFEASQPAWPSYNQVQAAPFMTGQPLSTAVSIPKHPAPAYWHHGPSDIGGSSAHFEQAHPFQPPLVANAPRPAVFRLTLGEYFQALHRHQHGLGPLEGPIAFRPERIQLHKKAVRANALERQAQETAWREWLTGKLNLPGTVSESALRHTRTSKNLALIAKLPGEAPHLASPAQDTPYHDDPPVQLLALDWDLERDNPEMVMEKTFTPIDAILSFSKRPAVSGANGRVVIESSSSVRGSMHRIVILITQPRDGSLPICSSHFAVIGFRDLPGVVRDRANQMFLLQDAEPLDDALQEFEQENICHSDKLFNDNLAAGYAFCWNSRSKDTFYRSMPALRQRLPVERQYCPECFAREDATLLVPPFERLGHERLWTDFWGVRMAQALAAVHSANGVAEPKIPMGPGITQMVEDDINFRATHAIDALDAGLLLPLDRQLLNTLIVQLNQRIYHEKMLLASGPSSVHFNSLWNVEASDSVVIRRDNIHLLNARLHNCRRSEALDPMENLARYVYLSRVVFNFKDVFRQKIEGPWLLDTYFTTLGFTPQARKVSTERFWLWLDLEHILYFYYFLRYAQDPVPLRSFKGTLVCLTELESITRTPFPIQVLSTPILDKLQAMHPK
ncbi:hypothetical protein BD324DRAFT_612097 [Kockovaella imperatae]|uniref:Uncharacterized protein n=1 Tax=Kockovaella imperatae TaxID=4999 RepID=A0A1Y1US47_9TREE|nr:hypothetical protein BD324DRAFT_612097 [Kockovaella imperatae]ORX40782.1 hypothetical protein BD324DRAFT_612097 [Kockovaella imperatae]